MHKLARIFFIACYVLCQHTESRASIVSFGSSGNSFQLEFIEVGDAGSAADTGGSPAGSGAVGYDYGISRFEISEGQIAKYNAAYGVANGLMISTSSRGFDRPATNVTWNEAARFVNWLNTSTGGFAAYKFSWSGVNSNISLWTAADTLDYDPLNPFRSIRATYVLPSVDEWVKAAFFDPVSKTYFRYATGSNDKPLMVGSGTGANEAVYHRTYPGDADEPADVDQAGGANAMGVTGMGGNVWEWLETESDYTNNAPNANRRYRGGSWISGDFSLSKSSQGLFDLPTQQMNNLGFRIVSLATNNIPDAQVPEPTSAAIALLIGTGALLLRRRTGI